MRRLLKEIEEIELLAQITTLKELRYMAQGCTNNPATSLSDKTQANKLITEISGHIDHCNEILKLGAPVHK